MNCVACGNKLDLKEIIKDHEINVTKVYDKITSSNKIDIPFYLCKKCGHAQILTSIPDNYYDEYELIRNPDKSGINGNYTLSQVEYYRNRLEELSQYALKKDMILDIGCGPGFILKEALNYFENGIGIEPSRIQTEIGIELNGVNIINSYFNETLDLGHKITAFICTQVLEHLAEPKQFLKDAYNKLEDGGVGFIEVPNGQSIINENKYYDILPDHINYYTILSLTVLVNDAGFEIIKIGEDFNSNYISAFIRKGVKYSGFENKKRLDNEKLNLVMKKYNKISIWGAGTKSRSFIDLINDKNKVLHIFDNNQNIQKYYLCDLSIPIENPTMEKINENQAIIIFALQYKKEIIKELREIYNFKGDIISMDDILKNN